MLLLVVLALIVFLNREVRHPFEVYPEPKVYKYPDPFERLAVLITPQELSVKAKARKKSSDPYIPATDYTAKQVDAIMQRAKDLHGKDKACFRRFIQDYKQSLLLHCEENNLGEETEGGCKKVTNEYSIHTRVIEEALNSCLKKPPA